MTAELGGGCLATHYGRARKDINLVAAIGNLFVNATNLAIRAIVLFPLSLLLALSANGVTHLTRFVRWIAVETASSPEERDALRAEFNRLDRAR